VGESLELRVDGGHDAWMAVTRIENCNTTSEINVSPSLDIPEFGVLRVGSKDFMRLSNATGNSRISPPHPFFVRCHEVFL
jgi:hypothetical protein